RAKSSSAWSNNQTAIQGPCQELELGDVQDVLKQAANKMHTPSSSAFTTLACLALAALLLLGQPSGRHNQCLSVAVAVVGAVIEYCPTVCNVVTAVLVCTEMLHMPTHNTPEAPSPAVLWPAGWPSCLTPSAAFQPGAQLECLAPPSAQPRPHRTVLCCAVRGNMISNTGTIFATSGGGGGGGGRSLLGNGAPGGQGIGGAAVSIGGTAVQGQGIQGARGQDGTDAVIQKGTDGYGSDGKHGSTNTTALIAAIVEGLGGRRNLMSATSNTAASDSALPAA
ncbi:hypothetical protein HaLaN_23409, partial [Haematococcus lacustris]